MPRIVSLIASATEMVCALGLEDQLVGRAHECDYPASVKKLPVCATVNFDSSGSSLEIDKNLKSHLKAGRPLYKIDSDLLEKLRPDVIITQSHCEVCAVNLKSVEQVVGKKTNMNPRIVSLQPNRLDDLWAGMKEVAAASNAEKKGNEEIARLQSRIRAIETAAKKADVKPRVACIEWIDPLMMSGNWVPELIEMAGGGNLFGEAGKHSGVLEWGEVVDADPDVLLVVPCGFDLERTRKEMRALSGKKEWFDLSAVLNNRVYLLDGNQYFNRPGPRLVESLEILAEIFHPEIFHFGHQNSAWEYFGIQGS